jgi:hypothetical protein
VELGMTHIDWKNAAAGARRFTSFDIYFSDLMKK